jgi:hypothetical protein
MRVARPLVFVILSMTILFGQREVDGYQYVDDFGDTMEYSHYTNMPSFYLHNLHADELTIGDAYSLFISFGIYNEHLIEDLDISVKINGIGIPNNDFTYSFENYGARTGLYLEDIDQFDQINNIEVYINIGDEEKTYSVQLNEANDGILYVDPIFENYINEWKTQEQNIFDYFDESGLPEPLILSFFQEFFNISSDEMATLQNNSTDISSFGISLHSFREINGENIFGKETTVTTTPDTTITPEGDTVITPDKECECKVIATNSDAVNIPNESNNVNPYSCGSAIPREDVIRHYHPSSKKLVNMRTSVLGAAKMANLRMSYVNGFKSGFQEFDFDAGPSKVSFNSVCINPNSDQVAFEKCSCEKEVTIEYKYNARVQGVTRKEWHPICRELAQMTVEDFAILMAIRNGNSAEEVASGLIQLDLFCAADTTEDFITDLTEITETVGGLFESAGTGVGLATEVIGAAGDVYEFVNNIATYNQECDFLNKSQTLFSGQKTYTISAGERIDFILGSRTEFRGKTDCRAHARGQVNTDFYLAAVLRTDHSNSDSTCCKEKIGSYVLGTVEGFPYDASPRGDGGAPDANYVGLVDDAPIGLSSLRTLVGSFIGLDGPWDGVFEEQCSGCSRVVINCFQKCGILRDCPLDTVGGRFLLDQVRGRNNLNVFPNPVTSGSQINIVSNEGNPLHKIELFNSQGQLVWEQQLNESEHANLIMPYLVSGIYYLRGFHKEGTFTTHSLIIQ